MDKPDDFITYDRERRETSHRIVNEPSTEPKLAIKTKLDPNDVTEENPYFNETNQGDKSLREFFEGENK